MKTRWIVFAGSIFLMTTLVNCSPVTVIAPLDTGASLPTQTPAPIPTIDVQPVLPQVQPPFGEASTESVKLAKQDLAHKLGISPDGVTVTTIIGEEYSTNAFYCRATKDRIAREDPPAVISGFTILLSASGRRYEYHASGQTVVFCRSLS